MPKVTAHRKIFFYLRDALIVASAYAERNIETFEEKNELKNKLEKKDSPESDLNRHVYVLFIFKILKSMFQKKNPQTEP